MTKRSQDTSAEEPDIPTSGSGEGPGRVTGLGYSTSAEFCDG